MTDILQILHIAVEAKASDIFIIAGAPINLKREGQIDKLDDEKMMPPETKKVVEEIYRLAGRSISRFEQTGDDDFSFAIPNLARFRTNTYRQRGSLAAVIRVVAFTIPDWRERNIPLGVMNLADLRSGLVLVAGTAGSGKSTTLACIIDRINQTRHCHIITLEDPIEYLHRDRESIISQREIATDTEDFHTALRACLRQTPDVIQLGELRDLETIRAAMTAAETGHLIFASLHTRDAATTIDRVVDVFPADQQEQVRIQLSMVLHTVVCQQLLPDINGGLVPAMEIMRVNSAIRAMIREKKNAQIESAILTGKNEGMQTMDQAIYDLMLARKISRQTALDHAHNAETIMRRM